MLATFEFWPHGVMLLGGLLTLVYIYATKDARAKRASDKVWVDRADERAALDGPGKSELERSIIAELERENGGPFEYEPEVPGVVTLYPEPDILETEPGVVLDEDVVEAALIAGDLHVVDADNTDTLNQLVAELTSPDDSGPVIDLLSLSNSMPDMGIEFEKIAIEHKGPQITEDAPKTPDEKAKRKAKNLRRRKRRKRKKK